jgi:hypothetical protein
LRLTFVSIFARVSGRPGRLARVREISLLRLKMMLGVWAFDRTSFALLPPGMGPKKMASSLSVDACDLGSFDASHQVSDNARA